ncbi:cytidine deaminase-like protein [Lineolata rhizophorae]|uniref:Deoxycytidylate deaminase n=1 Tax=Lineolata rhizophorae TaxID=578093 RepID=A0A6A6P145_9PEZI|nr:cytidine deaminase-like protein [Lineolata rhizophorae]
MLIGICGGIYAGKNTITDYLVDKHGFKRISLNPSIVPGNDRNWSLPYPIKTRGVSSYTFDSVDELLAHVTRHWRENYVTTELWTEDVAVALLHRPFFLLVSVDAPLMMRWKRSPMWAGRQSNNRDSPDNLFLLYDDFEKYSARVGYLHIAQRAHLHILNNTDSLPALHAQLGALDLPSESRLRPSWDQYFMQLASLAASRSNCMKRRVGAVLVRDRRVVSTGYNGTPRGIRNCNAGGCPRCNGVSSNDAEGKGNLSSSSGHALSTCLCLHAEENALLEAGRDRLDRRGEGEGSHCTLYSDTCPCLTCAVKIAQVGIAEVVYSKSYSMDSTTAAVLGEAGVELRQFSPISGGLVDVRAATGGRVESWG